MDEVHYVSSMEFNNSTAIKYITSRARSDEFMVSHKYRPTPE